MTDNRIGKEETAESAGQPLDLTIQGITATLVTSNNETQRNEENEMMTIALVLNGSILALLMFAIVVGILDGR